MSGLKRNAPSIEASKVVVNRSERRGKFAKADILMTQLMAVPLGSGPIDLVAVSARS